MVFWANTFRVNALQKEKMLLLSPVTEEKHRGMIFYQGIKALDLSEKHIASMISHWRFTPGQILTIPGGKAEDQQWQDYRGKVNAYTVSASSQLSSPSNAYTPERAFDRHFRTAWVEGAEGNGIGEWISLSFRSLFHDARALHKAEKELENNEEAPDDAFVMRPRLKGIVIIPGYAKSDTLFQKNNRPKTIRAELEFTNAEGTPEKQTYRLRLDDVLRPQFLLFDGLEEKDLFGICRLKLIIEEVYLGTHYQDACISEIKLFFSHGV